METTQILTLQIKERAPYGIYLKD